MPTGMKLSLDGVAPGEQLPGASEEEVAHLRKAFDQIDVDESGTIDVEEIKTLMEALGKEPSEFEIKTMMEFADKDGNGTIEFSEFCGMYGKYVAEERSDEEENLYQCFQVFDLDGNGYIERNELASLMASLGSKSFRAPPESLVDELIRDADKDGDGKINYQEFTKAMIEKGGFWGDP